MQMRLRKEESGRGLMVDCSRQEAWSIVPEPAPFHDAATHACAGNCKQVAGPSCTRHVRHPRNRLIRPRDPFLGGLVGHLFEDNHPVGRIWCKILSPLTSSSPW